VPLPQGGHRLLNFPRHAFPIRLPGSLMRLEAGSKDGGGNRKGLIGREGRSRAKGVPTGTVLRAGANRVGRCSVPGRAERIVNHRFSGIKARSKRTGTGANGGFYLGFSLSLRALAGRGCAAPRARVPLALGPREGKAYPDIH